MSSTVLIKNKIAVVMPRFNNLTAARFVAAILVYMHHSKEEYGTISIEFIKNFIANGYIGVSFFFILSGFVLASSNLKKMEKFTIRGTLSFYWKRISRIVPLWLFVSLPFVVEGLVKDTPGIWQFVTFSQAWSSDMAVAFGFLAVAWTLSVEMFFYAVFPLIAAGLRWTKGVTPGPVLVIVGLAIPAAGFLYFWVHSAQAALLPWQTNSSHYWLYRYPPMRFGEFLTGIGIYLCISRGAIRLSRGGTYLLGAACLAGLILSMGLISTGGPWFVFPVVVFLAGIVFLLAHIEILGIGVKARFPILLGEASFAFYLIHQWYFKGLVMPALVSHGGLAVAQVVTLVMAVCTSIGLFIALETPCRTGLLRLLRVRSSIPKAHVDE
jgi:peptidoglycan/LPS O-acetylase OafA/YrhL